MAPSDVDEAVDAVAQYEERHQVVAVAAAGVLALAVAPLFVNLVLPRLIGLLWNRKRLPASLLRRQSQLNSLSPLPLTRLAKLVWRNQNTFPT